MLFKKNCKILLKFYKYVIYIYKIKKWPKLLKSKIACKKRVPRFHTISSTSIFYIKMIKEHVVCLVNRILPSGYTVIRMNATLCKDKTYSLLILSIVYKPIYCSLHFNVFRLTFKYC